MKIHLLLVLPLFAQCSMADVAPNLEVGEKLGNRLGYGNGEHYFNNLVFDEKKPIKLLTKLVKGVDTYELTLSSDRVFYITSKPTNISKISIKFKCNHASEKYLVDIAYMPNKEIVIALTNPSSGYEIIKFKVVDSIYVPHLYAETYMLPGLISNDTNKAKEVGFAADGSFFIKRSDDSIDSYTLPEKGDYVFRNKIEYELSRISRYDSRLPDTLKPE